MAWLEVIISGIITGTIFSIWNSLITKHMIKAIENTVKKLNSKKRNIR